MQKTGRDGGVSEICLSTLWTAHSLTQRHCAAEAAADVDVDVAAVAAAAVDMLQRVWPQQWPAGGAAMPLILFRRLEVGESRWRGCG